MIDDITSSSLLTQLNHNNYFQYFSVIIIISFAPVGPSFITSETETALIDGYMHKNI